MSKINLGNQVFVYPMPVVLAGTKVDGRPNFMAVGWISRVNFKPPLIAMGISKGHHTATGIRQSGAFSVNVPSADMVAATDYCGLVSGKKTDKSKLFELFYGELESAPMITACPLNLECRLEQTVALETNLLFIGEIVAAYSEDRYLTDGQPDIKKINPLLLTMPDNGYWRVGEFVAKAWSVGKQLKKAHPTPDAGD
jgi:flavin reductase (DIM6/NTAB) family NADH-FMN oxidoreductase RutF